MELVFIHGPAAVGKLTVARELADLTGHRLFHNHLVVDLVASLFEFGSQPFVELRERIWLEAFRAAAEDDTSLIFTFNPEATVRPEFIGQTAEVMAGSGGRLAYVALSCAEAELERRIESPSRADFGKLDSLARYRELREADAFAFPALPEPLIAVDTGTRLPREAAGEIATALQSARPSAAHTAS